MLRGVVYGVGHMGTHHLRRLRERDDVEVGAVDPAHALSHQGPVDFAVVAVPTALHAEVALPLLERGIPCLIEKPLAATLEQARQLARHPHAMVGFIERFNPTLQVVAGLRPRFVQAERLAPFGGRSTDLSVVHDLMVHDLDLVEHLMPGALSDLRAIGLGVVTGAPDIANVRLEKGDGVALLTASRVSRSSARTLRLVADGVYWSLDLLAKTATRVEWGARDLSGTQVAVPSTDALVAEHQAFLDGVRNRGPMAIPAAAGVVALERVEAVVAALERRARA